MGGERGGGGNGFGGLFGCAFEQWGCGQLHDVVQSYVCERRGCAAGHDGRISVAGDRADPGYGNRGRAECTAQPFGNRNDRVLSMESGDLVGQSRVARSDSNTRGNDDVPVDGRYDEWVCGEGGGGRGGLLPAGDAGGVYAEWGWAE